MRNDTPLEEERNVAPSSFPNTPPQTNVDVSSMLRFYSTLVLCVLFIDIVSAILFINESLHSGKKHKQMPKFSFGWMDHIAI